MPLKNERLRTIQAEIDKCMNEMKGLDYLRSDNREMNEDTHTPDKSKTCKEILTQVIHLVDTMELSDKQSQLHVLLETVKKMLANLIGKINRMNFTDDLHWGKLKSRLDSLSGTLQALASTQFNNLSLLFIAIHDGIVKHIRKIDQWNLIRNREAYFKFILIDIGKNLKVQHEKFSALLSGNVPANLAIIEDILDPPPYKSSIPTQMSSDGDTWRQKLDQVRLIVTDMNLSEGGAMKSLEMLAKSKIDTILTTIIRYDLNNMQDTEKLYAEIKDFETISIFFNKHSDLQPLLTAVLKGIRTTVPSSEEWARRSLKQRKDVFFSCLHGIGTEICNANAGIRDSALEPIAGRIYRVGGILKNIPPET